MVATDILHPQIMHVCQGIMQFSNCVDQQSSKQLIYRGSKKTFEWRGQNNFCVYMHEKAIQRSGACSPMKVILIRCNHFWCNLGSKFATRNLFLFYILVLGWRVGAVASHELWFRKNCQHVFVLPVYSVFLTRMYHKRLMLCTFLCPQQWESG